MAAKKRHKAVLVLPDIGLSESHLERVKGEFQNHLVASLTRAGAADDIIVIIVVVVVYREEAE